MSVESSDGNGFWPSSITAFRQRWCLIVAVLDLCLYPEMESQKLTSCCFHTTLVDLFWVIFLVTGASIVDLGRALLLVLRRVRWNCRFAKRRLGLAVRRLVRWLLLFIFLLCSSGGSFLGYFPAISSFGVISLLGFVVGCEGNSMEVVSWLPEALVGRTMVCNSTIRWTSPLVARTSLDFIWRGQASLRVAMN